MLVLREDEADVRMRCIGWLPACSRHTGWIITCEKGADPICQSRRGTRYSYSRSMNIGPDTKAYRYG